MMRREQENAGATSASRMEIGAGGKRGDGSRGRRARRRDGLGTRRAGGRLWGGARGLCGALLPPACGSYAQAHETGNFSSRKKFT
uniref:Uncharacterized protein n=2 Tax=Oryza TaxID=4527 RepID=A0A0D3EPD4_9ORYZ